MKTTTTLLATLLIASLSVACAPTTQVRPDSKGTDDSSTKATPVPADDSSASAQAAPVLVDVSLEQAIQAAPATPEGEQVYRFLLTGHDGQRLDLHLWVDGKEVCRMAGRLDAKIHVHQYAKGPRLDRACVFPAPVANEAKVSIRDTEAM
ncbi:MAG: hypothetical protein JRF33_27495 [Deltaproteobacteria bacterium]|nr:hypothetical protein [Deltaproteobacteria bacterium]